MQVQTVSVTLQVNNLTFTTATFLHSYAIQDGKTIKNSISLCFHIKMLVFLVFHILFHPLKTYPDSKNLYIACGQVVARTHTHTDTITLYMLTKGKKRVQWKKCTYIHCTLYTVYSTHDVPLNTCKNITCTCVTHKISIGLF